MKKELSSCKASGVVCLLLHSGVREARERERRTLKSVSIPQPRSAWDGDTRAENTYFMFFLLTFSYKVLKEKEDANLLESISRSLSWSSLQAQRSEKYAQSYLVQNLGTSQISIPIEKRHSLLAFSQGLGQTFHFTCSLPGGVTRLLPKPLELLEEICELGRNTKNVVSK